ncbi:MAG: hypothetical protein HYY18_02980 [Planctomycetes bacterium]|nr:hypothetical protein [Planctomycetota bacterium]
MRARVRIWIVLALAAVAPGCRTLVADAGDYTKDEAIDKLRGYYPSIQEVTDTHISVPNYIEGGNTPLIILYSDIVRVRIVPQAKWFVLTIFVGTIYGPLVYNLEVELKNGWKVPVIFNLRSGLNLVPLWIYPNVLIHGYGPGYALDWLRQDAAAREAEPDEEESRR